MLAWMIGLETELTSWHRFQQFTVNLAGIQYYPNRVVAAPAPRDCREYSYLK
jgi:hypothetical protein